LFLCSTLLFCGKVNSFDASGLGLVRVTLIEHDHFHFEENKDGICFLLKIISSVLVLPVHVVVICHDVLYRAMASMWFWVLVIAWIQVITGTIEQQQCTLVLHTTACA
jgi:hypothetical protein